MNKLTPLLVKDEPQKSFVSENVVDEKVFFTNNLGQYLGGYFSEELNVIIALLKLQVSNFAL